MEKRIDRLEEKLDTVIEKLHEQNVILARNTESLIVHEKRTDLAEQKLELFQNEYERRLVLEDKVLNAIQDKLEPISKHVTIVNAVFKYMLPAISGLVVFLVKIGIIKFK